MNEMGSVGKADPATDVCDGLFLAKKGAGHSDAAAVDIFDNGESGLFLELTAQVVFADKKEVGQIVQSEAFGQMCIDVFDEFGNQRTGIGVDGPFS